MDCECCEDEEYVGPCLLHPRVVLALNILIFGCIAAVGTYAFLIDDRVNGLSDELSGVHVQEYTLDGGMRPQFFTFGASGDLSVPSGIIMPADGRAYSRSWCTFSENTRTAEVRFVIQGTVETSSAQLGGGVEVRFEIPYGVPIGTVPGASVEYSRCPTPQCGTGDYRTGIGAMGTFVNMESAFFTQAQVSQNRTHLAPAPVSCGCSAESPIRLSCAFSGAQLLPMDGAFSISGVFMYTTANLTVPLS